VIGRSILAGLLLGLTSIVASVGAAERCAECVTAGAGYAAFRVPPGTPLAGYGGLQRRLLFPDIFGRYRYAFWFRPSAGQHDPVGARALVLENPKARVAWVTVDLIAVDRAFTTALQERLTATSFPPATLIVSASHTHSGPGAFMDSELSGLLAVDRMDSTVRSALIEGVAAAIRRADGARAPALFAATRVTAPAVTSSRIREPLDPEIVVLKITRTDGKPLAVVWNFAIHGTMFPAGSLQLSGDVTGAASAMLEQRLGVPALFVNGAVGDVSPAGHGLTALSETAGALAAAVETGWAEARAVPAVRLHVTRQTVALPRPAVSLKRCAGGWVPGFFALPLFGLAAETELIGAAVGDTAWVTIPGELQTSFGLAIKRELRGLFGAVFLAGLSNDYLGYFMGPEAAASKSYVACATLYGPDTASCLADGALDVFYRLAERTRPAGRSSPRCAAGRETR
jgi:neutral ceramidase